MLGFLIPLLLAASAFSLYFGVPLVVAAALFWICVIGVALMDRTKPVTIIGLNPAQARSRTLRNWALGLCIAGFFVLFFCVTIVRVLNAPAFGPERQGQSQIDGQ